MNKAKDIILSHLLSIAWIIIFYILFWISFTILALAYGFLASVPLLKTILQISLFTGSTTLDALVYGTSGIVSLLILVAASSLIKKENIKNASFVLFGIEIIILNVVFLIINLVTGNSGWANGEFILIGIVSIMYTSNNGENKHVNATLWSNSQE